MSTKKIIQLKPKQEVLDFLIRAAEVVKNMPDWKIGVLEASSMSTNPRPRRPVKVSDEEQLSDNETSLIEHSC